MADALSNQACFGQGFANRLHCHGSSTTARRNGPAGNSDVLHLSCSHVLESTLASRSSIARICRQPQAKLGDSNLPKYCKGCTLASNMLFCKCGETVCRNKCSVTVPSCVECLAMTCGQAECIPEECDECGEFLCLSCTLECGPCYRMNNLSYLDSYLFSDDYYNEYCGYDHDSDYS